MMEVTLEVEKVVGVEMEMGMDGGMKVEMKVEMEEDLEMGKDLEMEVEVGVVTLKVVIMDGVMREHVYGAKVTTMVWITKKRA
jgi:hypothetical protein